MREVSELEKDIRWIQRFQNYQRAFSQLAAAAQLSEQRDLTNLEKQGMIQAFEFTHELAWKTLKDFLQERGNPEIYGSRDATREAFAVGLISDGDLWMEMIQSRNITSHTYNENVANEIVAKILQSYLPLFNQLQEELWRLSKVDE